MLEILLVILFILGYAAIALEQKLKVNKTASALFLAVFSWTIYSANSINTFQVNEQLSGHLASISEILFFLLGAMTIVELIDAHQGFSFITDRITSKNKVSLLWIVSILTFFLSSILDNLTTAIVMTSILRKLINEVNDRKIFAAMIIVAANAGGAWSPIGDITTTMLWIGGQVTEFNIVKNLFIPCVICLLVPLIFLSFKFIGQVNKTNLSVEIDSSSSEPNGSKLILFFGIGAFIFIPVFKTITQLPPYIGMLLGLAVVWIVSEIIHADKDEEEKKQFTIVHALSKIDSSSILFFLGILITIAALESANILSSFSQWMSIHIKNENIIVTSLGLLSAVIDNVPLIAATQGMYDLAAHPIDSKIWEFLAYATGTGGSILIIGSAAGIAVMGMEKIDFVWYFKKISLLALLGYFAGAITYLLLHHYVAY